MNKKNLNLLIGAVIFLLLGLLVHFLIEKHPEPSTSTKIDCTVPANVEPFLRERLNQLLTEQGSLAEKQAILDCIAQATSKSAENTVIVDGNYYNLARYAVANNANVIAIESIKFYPEGGGNKIESVKIQGKSTTLLLHGNGSNASKPAASASPILPTKWSGNIKPDGAKEEIIIESQTAVGNQIEFKFSVRFADKSGKHLAGKLDTQTKSVELERIGKGTYTQENKQWAFSLENNKIQITSN